MNPFQSQQSTVRMHLPPGMGRMISARGVTAEADEQGFVSVPRDVADELKSHLPVPSAEAIATGTADLADELEKIGAIDAKLLELQAKKVTLEAAVRRAEEMGTAAAAGKSVAELEEVTKARRRTIANVFMGLAKRSDVTALDARQKKAAAEAEQERQTVAFAALGQAELWENHIFPLDREMAMLREQRDAACARAVKSSAESAAIRYREALRLAGRAFAVVQAHAVELQAMERIGARGEVTQGRQSFGAYQGNVIDELPVFSTLQAFKDCPNGWLSIAFTPAAMNHHGAHELVDLAAVRAQVHQGFVKAGLLPA